MFSKLKMQLVIFVLVRCLVGYDKVSADQLETIDIIDMTHATNWQDLAKYYGALEKRWKICINCGTPTLGTAMHLEHTASTEAMHPAVIPSEYFLTNLVLIDATSLTQLDDGFVLTLEVALQWAVLKRDPQVSTLILFKFGWKEDVYNMKIRSCVCKIPGLSYELAEWITTNMSHVVGVGTDAPTLESEQTREFSTRTVSTLLGKNGVYMIENVNIRRKIPEQGCMAIVSPLKLLNVNYVPTTLTAYCPTSKTNRQVGLTLKTNPVGQSETRRIYDVDLKEIMY